MLAATTKFKENVNGLVKQDVEYVFLQNMGSNL